MKEKYQVPYQLLEILKNKQYNFGLETAVQQRNSSIQRIGNNFVLFFTPSNVEDKVWYGDCAANTLLVYKLLASYGLESHFSVINTEFEAEAASFSVNHFSVVKNIQTEYPLTLDHSLFYSNLNTPYKRIHVCEPIQHKEPLINAQNITQGKNYKEFVLAGERHLLSVSMGLDHKNGDKTFLGVYIYKQDEGGNVTHRYLSSYYLPSELPLSRKEVIQTFKFDSVLLTHSFRDQYIPFYDEQMRSIVIDSFVDILNSYSRGLKKTYTI